MQFVFDYGGMVHDAMTLVVAIFVGAGIVTDVCLSVIRREWWPLLAIPIFAVALPGILFAPGAGQRVPQLWRSLVRK